jgi:hypothetical protein
MPHSRGLDLAGHCFDQGSVKRTAASGHQYLPLSVRFANGARGAYRRVLLTHR